MGLPLTSALGPTKVETPVSEEQSEVHLPRLSVLGFSVIDLYGVALVR